MSVYYRIIFNGQNVEKNKAYQQNNSIQNVVYPCNGILLFGHKKK